MPFEHHPARPLPRDHACNPRSRPRPTPLPFRSFSPPKRPGLRIASELPEPARQFATANDFTAKPGKCLTLPAPDGKIAQVVFGLEDESSKSRDLFRPGALPGLLPPGVYRFANAPHDVRLATLAFALGTYRFGRYRKAEPARRPAGAARRHRCRRCRADGGGGSTGARPDQYAVERHGSGRTGAGGASVGDAVRRPASTASSATSS